MICCRSVQTCSKKFYYSPNGSIEINLNAEHKDHEYDCSFTIHLPVGQRINLEMAVVKNQDQTAVRKVKKNM